MLNSNTQTESSCGNKLAEIVKKYSIISKTDKHGIITYVNRRFCEVSGYAEDELIGKKHNIVRHPSSTKEIFQEMWDCISNRIEWSGLVCNKSKDGKEFFMHTIIFPILSNDNEILEYVAFRNDVTILIQQSKLLERMVYHDSLTGLGNYVMLNEVLRTIKEKEVFLTFIDINDFNEINNVFSYEIGDDILKLVAKRLLKTFKEAQIYRKGGDVFAILQIKSSIAETIEEFQNILITNLNNIFLNPFRVDTFETVLEVSIGLSHGINPALLYKNTEIALQKAKQSKQKIVLFEDSMVVDLDKNFINTKKITKELKEAIKQDRIVPYFQPIFNNKTMEIDKYECLARLVLNNGNIMPPGQFLEIAKKTKNYEEITRIMVKKSFEYFRDNDCDFAINISFTDIENKTTRKLILSEIKKFKSPKRVTFEILEDEDLINFAFSVENINFDTDNDADSPSNFFSLLRKYGCKIAIDDFGTGYSNFARLMQISADVLKIDGSLIKQIEQGSIAFLIVQQMNIIAHSMGIKTVAEFVSSEEIQQQVCRIGIDYSQGYYIGKPNKDIVDRESK